MNTTPTFRERVLGGLWGAVVGDALGVPVEFRSREEVQFDPVTGMRGYGSHNQPPGTWSDDSSLLACTVESLLEGYDLEDMGRRFVRWYRDHEWCPHGELFDIGGATSDALSQIELGTPAGEAGGTGEYSNGNGSLMRMLPAPLMFAGEEEAELLKKIHDVSAITHAHRRSRMVCGQFALIVRELLKGVDVDEAYQRSAVAAANRYGGTDWKAEFLNLRTLLGGRIEELNEDQIDSGGHVVDTLTASIWCLLCEDSYAGSVLRAVNLGGDTDTTGCVTGGMAGVAYGINDIPGDGSKPSPEKTKSASCSNALPTNWNEREDESRKSKKNRGRHIADSGSRILSAAEWRNRIDPRTTGGSDGRHEVIRRIITG